MGSRSRAALVLACLMGLGAVAAAQPPPPARTGAAPRQDMDPAERIASSLAGTYSSSVASNGAVSIKPLRPGLLSLESADFSAVGYFDGQEFAGVVRAGRNPVVRTPSGALAWVRMRILPDGTLEVTRWVGPGDADVKGEIWSRVTTPSPLPPGPTGDGGDHPELGTSFYVQELPEAVTKVPPEYPADARARRVQGTVILQVLVGREGRVTDVKVVRSIPELDAAAVAAARQWIFKPARGEGGKPVAVWLAVPMKFTLH